MAASLLLEARNAGIEGLDGEPVFISGESLLPETVIWASELETQYDAIGLIEVRDQVIIEERPLIRNGEILKQGVARKKRK